MWREGTIGIKVGSTDSKIAHYYVKAFDEPSEYGIDGGRISKLDIRIDGKQVLLYERGWEIEPDEDDEAAAIAYSIVMNDYN